jgi:tRNA nucleotidyltransferase (CCA-adding enzyme)
VQIVTTHKNCDFDGLASVVAVTLLHPGTLAVLPKALNPNVKAFLSVHKDVFDTHIAADIDLDAVRRLFVVDVAQWKRLDGLARLQDREDLAIRIWDHHPGQGDIETPEICQEAIGACITLLGRIYLEHHADLKHRSRVFCAPLIGKSRRKSCMPC